MRYTNNFQAGFFGVLVALFLGFSTVQAQTYSGEAAAVRVRVNSPPAPIVTTSVADTGTLPAAGGNVTLTSASVTVPDIVTIADANVATSGGSLAVPPDPNTSQSFASVNALDLEILNGVTISADAVRVDTLCSCVTGTCTGTMTVTNLSITDPDSNNTILNGTITSSSTIDLFAGGIVIGTVGINEQLASPGSIAINAIHVVVTVAGVTTDVIVSTAHSDITCAVAPVVNLYSGRATGIRNRNRTLADVDVTTLVSDTGFLPTTGGKINVTTVGASVGPIVTITSGTVTANTAGGPQGAPPPPPFTDANSSASDSTVEDLFLNVGLVTVTADAVSSNTRCTCSLSLPTCVGDSVLTNLDIAVFGFPLIEVPISVPPNTVIPLPLGLGSITINEQFVEPPSPSINPENITVNAVHLRLNVLGLAVSDTVIASSHSDIDCSTAPTAAPVALSGRVTDRYGRGISSVIVTVTDGQGFTKSARTNTFGYYGLKGIPAGEGYVVTATSRGYQFSPRFVSMTDNVSGFNFSPDGGGRFKASRQELTRLRSK